MVKNTLRLKMIATVLFCLPASAYAASGSISITGAVLISGCQANSDNSDITFSCRQPGTRKITNISSTPNESVISKLYIRAIKNYTSANNKSRTVQIEYD